MPYVEIDSLEQANTSNMLKVTRIHIYLINPNFPCVELVGLRITSNNLHVVWFNKMLRSDGQALWLADVVVPDSVDRCLYFQSLVCLVKTRPYTCIQAWMLLTVALYDIHSLSIAQSPIGVKEMCFPQDFYPSNALVQLQLHCVCPK